MGQSRFDKYLIEELKGIKKLEKEVNCNPEFNLFLKMAIQTLKNKPCSKERGNSIN